MLRKRLLSIINVLALFAGSAASQGGASARRAQTTGRAQTKRADRPALKFDFGPGKLARGYTQVLPTTVYSKELGYGFEPGASVQCLDRGGRDPVRGDFCTSDKPFYFSVALP